MSNLTDFISYNPKILVQRFTISMGTYVDGAEYWTLGSAKIIESVSSTDGSCYMFSPDGPAARFVYVNLGRAVNPNKSFLTYSHSGHTGPGNQLTSVRLYNHNDGVNEAYPSATDTVAFQVQLKQRANWPKSTFGSARAPEISVEVIEYT